MNCEITDIHGQTHILDFDNLKSSFINCDCLEAMKKMPDKCVDLAITDPPYGAGFTESGGCKGWFSKYHQNAEPIEILGGVAVNKDLGSMAEAQNQTILGTNTCERTGGTWAKKYGKKSYRGTLPLEGNTLKNSFASHGIRSYGAGITLNFHRQDAL